MFLAQLLFELRGQIFVKWAFFIMLLPIISHNFNLNVCDITPKDSVVDQLDLDRQWCKRQTLHVSDLHVM